MNPKIDELDLNILRELKKNGRESFRGIADRLKVAEGTIYNRVNKLQEIGVIRGFLLDIDYAKLGFDLTAVIGIRVEGPHLPTIEKEIAKSQNVSAVYDVTGEFDAIIVAKFKDRDSLNDFVKKVLGMPHVQRTNTMLVLNVVKEAHGVEI